MARAPVNQQVANSVVGESLGISMDDLGADRPDTFADLDLGDDDGDLDLDGDLGGQLSNDRDPGDGNDNDDDDLGDLGTDNRQQQPEPKDNQQQLDDLGVTHTPKDEFDIGNAKPVFDKAGNIVAKNGRIIAKAGKEARMFTTLHKARSELSNTITQANTIISRQKADIQKAVELGMNVNAQLVALREAGSAHTRAGLNDQDHAQAIELAVAFKKDPVQAIKTILTRASASGIDLTTLGLQPGGFDTKALMDLIRGELGTVTKPIVDRTKQETEQQRIVRENNEKVANATTELNEFLTAAPEARQYLPVFQRVLSSDDPKLNRMSLGEIWARIQLNLLKNPPQQQRQQQQRNGRQQRSPNRQQQQPRMPQGRSTPPDGSDFRSPNELADVSTSYEDIVKGVLRAAG